eukprot:GHRR01005010.1.p1 GENE.GHRR01005010.1~~GHRR01005010.1.p1  ORF type:complete len:362 (+),score=159.18 GHRR01005010.1:511-1596(+)
MLDEKPGQHWLDCFVSESRKLLPTFPSCALVTVMWAFAMLQHRPPNDWMQRCLSVLGSWLAASSVPQWDAAGQLGIAGQLQSVSSANTSLVLLQRPQRPAGIDRGMLSLTALSAGQQHNGSPDQASQQRQQQSPPSSQQLSRLTWALAALDCKLPAGFMELLMLQTEHHIEAMDPSSLADLVWALDKLDETQDKLWVRRFTATARARLLHNPMGTAILGSARLNGGAIAGMRPAGVGSIGLQVRLQQPGGVAGAAVGQGPLLLVRPVRRPAGASSSSERSGRLALVAKQKDGRSAVAGAATASSGGKVAFNLSRAVAAAAAVGLVVQPEIAEGLSKGGKASKQELLVALSQLRSGNGSSTR